MSTARWRIHEVEDARVARDVRFIRGHTYTHLYDYSLSQLRNLPITVVWLTHTGKRFVWRYELPPILRGESRRVIDALIRVEWGWRMHRSWEGWPPLLERWYPAIRVARRYEEWEVRQAGYSSKPRRCMRRMARQRAALAWIGSQIFEEALPEGRQLVAEGLLPEEALRPIEVECAWPDEYTWYARNEYCPVNPLRGLIDG